MEKNNKEFWEKQLKNGMENLRRNSEKNADKIVIPVDEKTYRDAIQSVVGKSKNITVDDVIKSSLRLKQDRDETPNLTFKER